MTGSGSVSNRNNEVNEIIRRIMEFADYPLRRAVNHFYTLGYTYRKVGEILDMSHTTVENRFPKEAHE